MELRAGSGEMYQSAFSGCVFRVRLAVEETVVRIDQFLSSCLQPMSDQDSTSHDNINAISRRKVMRIKRNYQCQILRTNIKKNCMADSKDNC